MKGRMKTLIRIAVLAGALQWATLTGVCADTKTYQVTGPVLELTDKMIVVQKGNDRWEIARDQNTKVEGELKVGSKVTIQYRMTAVSVEAKAEGKKKKAAQ
jgi:RNase P/RNase MRP subunit p29